MPRRKIIPDAEVLATVRRLLADEGEKAVAFGSVARATGLAAPTLVQRFASRDSMLQAAILDAWDLMDAATAAAETGSPISAKGAATFLKAIGQAQTESNLAAFRAVEHRDRVLRERAEAWRARVESALALRLGGGTKGREAAAIAFAAWQGQATWTTGGERSFRLRDMIRRLT